MINHSSTTIAFVLVLRNLRKYNNLTTPWRAGKPYWFTKIPKFNNAGLALRPSNLAPSFIGHFLLVLPSACTLGENIKKPTLCTFTHMGAFQPYALRAFQQFSIPIV